jgi:hypothetical protein
MLAKKKRNFEDVQRFDLLVSSLAECTQRLAECTQRDRKKQKPYLPGFLFVSQSKKTKSKKTKTSIIATGE